MFHNERKLRFLNEYLVEESTRSFVKYIFETSEPVERQEGIIIGKDGIDLCEFSRDQVLGLYKKFNYKTRKTLYSVSYFLTYYYAWCAEQGYDVSPFNQYDSKLSNSIIEEVIPREFLLKRYFTKIEFMEYMNNVKDPSNKFMMYALYNGVNLDELINLTIDDLDTKNKEVLLFSGRRIKVDDLFISLMQQANEALYYNPDGDNSNRRYDLYEYAESKYVIKPTKRGDGSVPITKFVLTNRMKDIKNQSGNLDLTVLVIIKNGLINYIKEKLNMSLKEAMTETVATKVDTDDDNDESIVSKGVKYAHYEDVKEKIEEFGSNITVRALRKELEDVMDYFG